VSLEVLGFELRRSEETEVGGRGGDGVYRKRAREYLFLTVSVMDTMGPMENVRRWSGCGMMTR